jgi:uncharacterized protein (DUF488 family)
VLTIGHSNRAIEEFVALLKAHGVELVVDVRTVPRSRHNPQFNRDTLPGSLQTDGIGYEHLPGLGGLRRPRADSLNTGWKNLHFRGYADYMQTEEFVENLRALEKLERGSRTAIMCAESVPWRCHRSLIADALTARGFEVRHILSATKASLHQLTAFARVEGNHVTYPAESLHLFNN